LVIADQLLGRDPLRLFCAKVSTENGTLDQLLGSVPVSWLPGRRNVREALGFKMDQELGSDPDNLLDVASRDVRELSFDQEHGIEPLMWLTLKSNVSSLERLDQLLGSGPVSKLWFRSMVVVLVNRDHELGSGPVRLL
jgi:hypothetical protein